jgi:CDP-L-myo-inositol myo-inositolphosphotransferase
MNPKGITFPVVILAAGEGKRLSLGGDIPKPLTRLLGLTFLERAILTCKRAGAEEFYVVVGHAKEKVMQHIQELRLRHGISIEVIENPEWQEGNGTSALAASKVVRGPFLLLMVDHIFEPWTLESFSRAAKESERCLLAVDPRSDRIPDLEDATKVKFDGQDITAIGKGLSTFDAVDMGLFFCTHEFFRALEEARREGNGTLTGGVERLSSERKIGAVRMGEGKWFDIDSPEILSFAKRALLSDLPKPREDGYISRYINRRVSIPISERLVSSPLTPSHLTLLTFLMCLVGATLFGLGGYLNAVAAGIIIQLSSILDGCDGEIARLKLQSSAYGAWLDTVLDRYADIAIVLGVTYQHWSGNPSPWVWVMGIMAALGFVLVSYTKKEYSLRYGKPFPTDFLEKLTKRDLRFFGIFVGALLGHPFEAVIALAAFSHFWIVWSFVGGGRLIEGKK